MTKRRDLVIKETINIIMQKKRIEVRLEVRIRMSSGLTQP